MTLRLLLIQRGVTTDQDLYGLVGRPDEGGPGHFVGVFSASDAVQYGVSGIRSADGDPFQRREKREKR